MTLGISYVEVRKFVMTSVTFVITYTTQEIRACSNSERSYDGFEELRQNLFLNNTIKNLCLVSSVDINYRHKKIMTELMPTELMTSVIPALECIFGHV